MATIKNNLNSAIQVNYVGGENSRFIIYPGINLNVPDKEWESISKHQLIKNYLEIGILSYTKTARGVKVKGKIANFDVADDKKTDEPLPVVDAKLSGRGVRPAVEKGKE